MPVANRGLHVIALIVNHMQKTGTTTPVNRKRESEETNRMHA
jgi:hypothetical protein